MGRRDGVTALADDVIAMLFEDDPMYASMVGVGDDYDGRLPDRSTEAEAALLVRLDELARRAEALDPTVDRDVVAEVIAETRGMTEVRSVEYTVTAALNGPLTELFQVCRETPIHEPENAADYLDRLRAIPGYLRTIAERHRLGTAAGRTGVERLVRAAMVQAESYVASPGGDPFAVPQPPAGWDGGSAWRSERDRVLADLVRPAVVDYRDAVAAHVLPRARDLDHPGLCHLPGGAEDYAKLVAAYTTTRRTPDEIHKIGLDAIASLADEFAEVGGRAFGLRESAEIFESIRDRPDLRYSGAEEILATARETIKRAEAAAPRWFGRLPGVACPVEPIPAEQAAHAPAGYYMSPATDGSRPGTFFANTHDATNRLRLTGEALAFHEAVPGHHVQISIAQQLTDLPLLRRVYLFSAYAEGWGLYCERLADEMGLYSDDIARLGLLSTEARRAARLVTDTGLHAMGWSRDRAVAYCLDNTPMARRDIEAEIDRYIACPAQALAYMVGRMEFQRVRKTAEQTLGDRFDIRAFHDVVLGSGAVPLGVLDEIVGRWVAETARAG